MDGAIVAADDVARRDLAPTHAVDRCLEAGGAVRAQAVDRIARERFAAVVVEDVRRLCRIDGARLSAAEHHGRSERRLRALHDQRAQALAPVGDEGGEIDELRGAGGLGARLRDHDAAVRVTAHEERSAGVAADRGRHAVDVGAQRSHREIGRDRAQPAGFERPHRRLPAPGAVPGAVYEQHRRHVGLHPSARAALDSESFRSA